MKKSARRKTQLRRRSAQKVGHRKYAESRAALLARKAEYAGRKPVMRTLPEREVFQPGNIVSLVASLYMENVLRPEVSHSRKKR